MERMVLWQIPRIIILFIIFYLIIYVLNRFKLFKNNTKFKIVIAVLSTSVIYPLSIYILFSFLLNSPKKDFNKELWKSNIEIRSQMIDDLLSSKKLIGISEKELINIIGEPEKRLNNKTWEYEILGISGMNVKVTKLKIIFIDNKVSEVIKSENIF